MHGIEDRLRALGDLPSLAPPADARRRTLEAMSAAALAAEAGAEAEAAGRDAERSPGSASDGHSRPQGRTGRAAWGPSTSVWSRAAVWPIVVGVVIAGGAIALRSPPADRGAAESLASGPSVRDRDSGAGAALTAASAAAGAAASTGPSANESAESLLPTTETLFELAVAAAQLDLMLADLPRQREVTRLGTVGTIIGLEDQIRLIDSEIQRADATAAPLEYRAALMRDRVDVLNALYYVRYAQSSAFTF